MSRLSCPRAVHLSFILFASIGCGLESPQAPSWETRHVLPLSQDRWTAAEWVAEYDSSIVVEGDSTSLFVESQQALDPLAFSSFLTVDDTSAYTSASLRDFEIEGHIGSTSITLASLLPEFNWVEEPIHVDLPPFEFSTISYLGDLAGADWIEVDRGAVRVSMTNLLPVSIFEPLAAPDDRVLRLLSADDLSVIAEYVVGDAVAPGQQLDADFDLAGKTVPGRIALQLTGSSPGSNGPVLLDIESPIVLDAYTSETFVIAAISGRLESMAGEFASAVELASADVNISRASVSTGTIQIEIDNGFPLGMSFNVEFPDLHVNGVPLALQADAPARTAIELSADLAGAILTNGEPTIRIHVVSEDRSSHPITITQDDIARVGVSVASVSFAELTGIFPGPIELSAADIDIELPTLPGGINPTSPRGFIVFEERPDFDCWIDVVVTPVGGGPELHVAGHLQSDVDSLSIEPESLAEFLLHDFEAIDLHAEVLVEGATTTVSDDDSVKARIHVGLPFEFDVNPGTHTLDPTTTEISAELSDLLVDHVTGAELVIRAESMFPVALELDLRAVSVATADAPDSLGEDHSVASVSLDAPARDEHGHPMDPIVQEVRIGLGAEEIDALFADAYVATSCVIDVRDSGHVAIYGNDQLSVRSHVEFSLLMGGN